VQYAVPSRTRQAGEVQVGRNEELRPCRGRRVHVVRGAHRTCSNDQVTVQIGAETLDGMQCAVTVKGHLQQAHLSSEQCACQGANSF